MELKKYKLADIANIEISGVDKKTIEGETPVRLCNFVDVYYNWAITKEKAKSFMLASAKQTEIDKCSIGKGMVAITKDSETRDDIGIATYIANDFEDVLLGYHCALITPNPAIVDGKYLNAFMHTRYIQKYFENNASGSGQRYTLSNDTIGNIPVLLPSIEVQHTIGKVLSDIDRKIELNKQINDNLEQQAQALFKSWFVDFEPFKGEKFVESQLGMIPKGWKVGTLSDLLDIRYGKDHKKLNDGNIPVYGSGGIMRLADGILYNGESVLIPRKGTLNNVLYVNWPFWTVDTMFYSIEKVPNVAKYCHLLLSKLDLASMNSGSAVPSMTTDILNKIQVIVANQDVFSSFNECISSLYLKAKINLDENKRLSETRDLLLPKLMSGRLIIKDLHS